MKPSNHRLAERTLIEMVRTGAWRIDANGAIWRRTKSGERRAEKVLSSGYGMVRAMLGGRRVVGLAHRLVWQHLRGDIPEGLVVNHRNGRKDDNRLCNLEVVTYSENARHAHRVLGRCPQAGTNNPMARLTPLDVAEIRLARLRGDRAVEIAARFGIRYQHVYKLCSGERWGHLAAPDLREFPAVRA